MRPTPVIFNSLSALASLASWWLFLSGRPWWMALIAAAFALYPAWVAKRQKEPHNLGWATATAGLLGCALLWKLGHDTVIAHTQTDVFRGVFSRHFAPFYAKARSGTPHFWWGISAFTASYLVTLFLGKNKRLIAFAGILGCFAAVALINGPENFLGTTAHWNTLTEKLDNIPNLADFWKYHGSYLHQLDTHNSHYPPGMATVLKLFSQQIWILKVANYLLLALSLMLFYTPKPEVNFTYFSALLLLPAVVFYPFADALGFFVFPGLLAYRWVVRCPSDRTRIFGTLAGVALFAMSLFSFMVFPWGLLLGLTVLFMERSQAFKFAMLLRMAVVFALSHALVFALAGWNIIETLQAAIAQNKNLLGNPEYFNPFDAFVMRSTGNLLQFLLMGGPLLVWWVFSSLKQKDRTVLPIFIGIVLLSFSGLFYLETDRIWYLLYPVLLISIRPNKINAWQLGAQAVYLFLVFYYLDLSFGSLFI